MSANIGKVDDEEPEEGEIKDDGSLEEVSSSEEIFQDLLDLGRKKSHGKHSKNRPCSRLNNEECEEKIRRPRKRPSLLRDFRSMREYRSTKDKERALTEALLGEKENRDLEEKSRKRNWSPLRNNQTVLESSESLEVLGNGKDGADRHRESSPSSSKSGRKHKSGKGKHKRKKKCRRYSHDSESETTCNTDSAVEMSKSTSDTSANGEHKQNGYSTKYDPPGSPLSSSDVEILEVPPKIPEVITLDDSDDDGCRNKVGNTDVTQNEDKSLENTSLVPEGTQNEETTIDRSCQYTNSLYDTNFTQNEGQEHSKTGEENNSEANKSQEENGEQKDNERQKEGGGKEQDKGQEQGREQEQNQEQDVGVNHGAWESREKLKEINQRIESVVLGCDAEQLGEAGVRAESDRRQQLGQDANVTTEDTLLPVIGNVYSVRWSSNGSIKDNSASGTSGTDEGSMQDGSEGQTESASELLISTEDSFAEGGVGYAFETEVGETGKNDTERNKYTKGVVGRLRLDREGILEDDVLQLRLNALRSAMLRKHMERKQRGVILAKRRKSSINSISPLMSPNPNAGEEAPSLPLSPPPERPPLPPGPDWAGGSTFNLNEEANDIVVDMDLADTDEERDRGHNDNISEVVGLDQTKAWYPENVGREEVYPQETAEPIFVPPLSPPPLPPFIEDFGLIIGDGDELIEEKTPEGADVSNNAQATSEDVNATPAFVDGVLYQENVELNVFSNNQRNGQLKGSSKAIHSEAPPESTGQEKQLCMCEGQKCACQRTQGSKKVSQDGPSSVELQGKKLFLEDIFHSKENGGNCIEIDLHDMIVLDEIGRTSSDSDGKSTEILEKLRPEDTLHNHTSYGESCYRQSIYEDISDASNENSEGESLSVADSDFETDDEVGTVDDVSETEIIRIFKEANESLKAKEKKNIDPETESNKDMGSDACEDDDPGDNNTNDEDIKTLRAALLEMLDASTKSLSSMTGPCVSLAESAQKKNKKQVQGEANVTNNSPFTELKLTREEQNDSEGMSPVNGSSEEQKGIGGEKLPNVNSQKNEKLLKSFPKCFNVQRMVINLGEDSDSGEEQSSGNGSQVPSDFEQKLDQLLKQARSDQEVDVNRKEDEPVTPKTSLTVEGSGNVPQSSKLGAAHKAGNNSKRIDGSSISEVRGSFGPSVSLVDIGLLPSFKQQEYLRLKKHLALKEKEARAKKNAVAGPSCSVSKKGNMQRLVPLKTNEKIQAKGKRVVEVERLEIPIQARGGVGKRNINNRKFIRRLPERTPALQLAVSRNTRIVTSHKSVGGIYVTTPNMLRKSNGQPSYRRVISSNKERVVTETQSPSVQKINIQVTAPNKFISGSQCNSKPQSETVVSANANPKELQNDEEENATFDTGNQNEKGQEKTTIQACGKRSIPPPETPSPKKTKTLTAVDGKKGLTEDQKGGLLGQLREWESDLISERYKVLEEVSSIRENLHEVQAVNFFRVQANAEIKRLEVQLQQMKNYVIEKDRQLKVLNNHVERSKKLIMRSQSETMVKLLRCKEFGFQLYGDAYTAPSNGADALIGRMREISKAIIDLSVGQSVKVGLQSANLNNASGKPGTSSHTVTSSPTKQVPQPSSSPDPTRTVQYLSPLDAMKHQEPPRDHQTVLCPYNIMGTCRDRECVFRH